MDRQNYTQSKPVTQVLGAQFHTISGKINLRYMLGHVATPPNANFTVMSFVKQCNGVFCTNLRG